MAANQPLSFRTMAIWTHSTPAGYLRGGFHLGLACPARSSAEHWINCGVTYSDPTFHPQLRGLVASLSRAFENSLAANDLLGARKTDESDVLGPLAQIACFKLSSAMASGLVRVAASTRGRGLLVTGLAPERAVAWLQAFPSPLATACSDGSAPPNLARSVSTS
jgi:hypothetical protein